MSSSGRATPAAADSSGERTPKRARNAASPSNSTSNSPSKPAKNPRKSSSPFPDFESYMLEKNRKLSAQFEADASSRASLAAAGGRTGGGIFSGVSIFVDGFTVPSSQELKEIMLNHGGRLVNYFSRHTVTHIICNHLPSSKMRNLRAFSKGLPVVKPSWVVDSLVESRLLSWVPYQISEHCAASCKQMKLSAFFTHTHVATHNQEEQKHQYGGAANETYQEESQDRRGGHENEGLLSNDEIPKELLSAAECKVSTYEGQCSEDFAITDHANVCQTESSERRDNNIYGKQEIVQPPDVNSRFSSLCSTSHSVSTCSSEPSKRSGEKASSRPHSTLTDPNFVENYFKYSRLHFIGTWRNRYRKRFSNFLGAKASTSNSDHSGKRKTIIHIDMDCFFVAVVIRNLPELIDKPVAVCHSDNPKGTAEISSANYPARNYGIKAGMFVRDAKARCPHLLIVPYNFEAYEEVADQFYGILHKHCNKVQALSCDEAFLDMTECSHDDPEEIARIIRKEIVDATRCTASAGIAENMLLARLATRSAKPNGQCFIPSKKVDQYLNELPIKALPGIGYTVADKLKSREVEQCGQLRTISKDALHKDFGEKTGDMLWNYCRGIDHSAVEAVQATKSVGAEVNWGVRFNDHKDAENFLMNLCKEVYLRLQGCAVQGRTITLKVKTRREGAGEPVKFLGCGDCETTSRSMTIAGATDNLTILQRIAKQIFATFHVDVKEIRGVGLKMSRLEHVDIDRRGLEGKMLELWLASPSEKLRKQHSQKTGASKHSDNAGTSDQQDDGNYRTSSEVVASYPSEVNLISGRSSGDRSVELPPLCHLDMEVLANLPLEIISEMNDMYKGKLHSLLDMHRGAKGREGTSMSPVVLPEQTRNSIEPVHDAKLHESYGCVDSTTSKGKDKNSICNGIPQIDACPDKVKAISSNDLACPRENKGNTLYKCTTSEESERQSEKLLSEIHGAYPFRRSNELIDKPTNIVKQLDLMPGSLSQADFSVMQQLPEDVKADLFDVLPLHRSGNAASSSSNVSANKFPNAGRNEDPDYSRTSLLSGRPPQWVEQFRVSSCLILNVIAEQYMKFSSNDRLSLVLQSIASFLHLGPKSSSEEWDAALSCLSDLFTQYVHLKVESDIEELHACFRLLKRFSSASEFFLELLNSILPFLQASVNEYYGGILQF